MQQHDFTYVLTLCVLPERHVTSQIANETIVLVQLQRYAKSRQKNMMQWKRFAHIRFHAVTCCIPHKSQQGPWSQYDPRN